MINHNSVIRKGIKGAGMLCVAAALQGGLVANAVPTSVTYEASNGTDVNFGFSYLHSGSGTGGGFAMNGDPKGHLNGSLAGVLDPSTSMLTNVSGILTVANDMSGKFGAIGGDLLVEITGGALRGDLMTDGMVGGTNAGGYLTYQILDSNDPLTVLDSGDFFFMSKGFANAAVDPRPNSLDSDLSNYDGLAGDDFALWGNNWLNTGQGSKWDNIFAALTAGGDTNAADVLANAASYTDADLIRLGIDLRGYGDHIPQAPPSGVPEPITATMGVISLGVLSLVTRRRSAH